MIAGGCGFGRLHHGNCSSFLIRTFHFTPFLNCSTPSSMRVKRKLTKSTR